MEFPVYRLVEMIQAEGQLQNNPAAAQSNVLIHGVDSLKDAHDMLRRAELVHKDHGTSITNIDPLRLLVRSETLVSDIFLNLVPSLVAGPDLVPGLDNPDGTDARILQLVAYVEAIERLSTGIRTMGVFPAFVQTFINRVTNAVNAFEDEGLTRPQLIHELQAALVAFDHSAETEYLPIP